MKTDQPSAVIIGEWNDQDCERLFNNVQAAGDTAVWFRLGLPSSAYDISWYSDSTPKVVAKDTELNADVIRLARWVFHKQSTMRQIPLVHMELDNPDDRNFAEREWMSSINCALLALRRLAPKRWFSPYGHGDYKDLKLYLFLVASEYGLSVPQFALGTVFELPVKDVQVVVKPINSDEQIGQGRYYSTTLLSDEHVRGFLGQRAECPSLVQCYIKRSLEWRVFFLGGSYICLELHIAADVVDSRFARILEISTIDLPPAVRHSVARFVDEFRFRYCVFDFVIDQSGTAWLTDITPNGSWWWYEQAGNVDITSLVLQTLERRVDLR